MAAVIFRSILHPLGHCTGHLRNDQTSQKAVNDPFLLQQIQFQALATALVLLLCFVGSKRPKIQHALGFLYLFSIPAKLFFFYYFFPELFVASPNLSTQEKVYILLPLAFFLLLEVFGLAKLLRQKPSGTD